MCFDDIRTYFDRFHQAETNTGRLGIGNIAARCLASVDTNIAGLLETTMGARNAKHKFNNNISIEHTSNTLPFKSPSKRSNVYTAKFDYKPARGDELEIKKGDQIIVTVKENDGWWQGQNGDKTGWFPCNYVTYDNEAQSPDYAMPDDLIPSYKELYTDVICTVKTLYPFQSQVTEELSFDKDLVLQIIEKPKDDPDWWMARTFNGQVGLIPRNYVQEINRYTGGSSLTLNARGVNTDCSFVNEEWFHGSISRHDCEKLLLNYGVVGEFLLRESESKVNSRSHNEQLCNSL